MSAAKKYKYYKPEKDNSLEQKKAIDALKHKITDKIVSDPKLQIKAALILERLINNSK